MKRSVVSLVLVLLLAACGGDVVEDVAAPSPSACAKTDLLLFDVITVGGKASAEEAAADFARSQASRDPRDAIADEGWTVVSGDGSDERQLRSGDVQVGVAQGADGTWHLLGTGLCGAPSPMRTGPLESDSVAASCVEGYNVTTIGNRAFAFDGTVVSIGPGGTNRADKGVLDTVAVTFAVQEWFKGGTGDRATVDLMSPSSYIGGDETPMYEEGTRLLVSGEPRWGGQPLEDAIAWSCGGFTRYYEPAVADEWRRGTA